MATTKNIKVTFFGGAHNSRPINILIPRAKYQYMRERGLDLSDILTPAQDARLTNHFCGISGCCCGSWTRADYDSDEDIKLYLR